jgi:hypothetical protein
MVYCRVQKYCRAQNVFAQTPGKTSFRREHPARRLSSEMLIEDRLQCERKSAREDGRQVKPLARIAERSAKKGEVVEGKRMVHPANGGERD